MAWVRIDDKFPQHPKIASAGPLAIAMQVAGLCYCNRELTDGFIPRPIARTLLDWQFEREDGRLFTVAVTCGMVGDDLSSQWVIDLLCEVGMWVEVPGGYQIHDYTDYQPTKQQVLEERERKVAAGKAGGQASAQARASAAGKADAKQTLKQNPTPKPNPNNVSIDTLNVPPVVPQGDEKQHDDDSHASKPTKRAHQLPDDFTVTDDMRSWASENVPSVPVDAETENFRDHHRAKGSVMKDWTAAWRTWMRNAVKFGRTIPAPPAQPAPVDRVAKAIAEKERLLAGEWASHHEKVLYTVPPSGADNLARQIAYLDGIIDGQVAA